MADSKIHICNTALAATGSNAIRSFDEDNKRARMADVFFESIKRYLLSRFDWPFARKFAKLQPLADVVTPAGIYAYALPSECMTPRDMHPPGSRDYWDVQGRVLLCKIPPEDETEVFLYYTADVTDSTLFSYTFANLLSIALAVRMSPALTQDDALTAILQQQYEIEMREVWESDANIGNDYRTYDETPDNDTFVSAGNGVMVCNDEDWRFK